MGRRKELKAKQAKIEARRRFLKKAVIGAGGLGLLLGTVKVADYGINQYHCRQRYPICDEELAELERLALDTHKGVEFSIRDFDAFSLSEYEFSFKLSLGPDFSYQTLLSRIKKRFPYDKHLVVVDIGGAYGEAAEGLQELKGIEAFVIDPATKLNEEGVGLPRNRFFVRKIEETGLPDETFHFMTSYNTYQYTQVPTSFVEAHRLLKRGGMAIIDVPYWWNTDFWDKLTSSNIHEQVYVASTADFKKFDMMPSSVYHELVKTAYANHGKDAGKILMKTFAPSFIILKK